MKLLKELKKLLKERGVEIDEQAWVGVPIEKRGKIVVNIGGFLTIEKE